MARLDGYRAPPSITWYEALCGWILLLLFVLTLPITWPFWLVALLFVRRKHRVDGKRRREYRLQP